MRAMFFWKTEDKTRVLYDPLVEKYICYRVEVVDVGEKGLEGWKRLTKLTHRSLENANPAKEKHFELAADERKQSEITSLWEVEKR